MCSPTMRTHVPAAPDLVVHSRPRGGDLGAAFRERREAAGVRRQGHRHALVDRVVALQRRSARGRVAPGAAESPGRHDARAGPTAPPSPVSLTFPDTGCPPTRPGPT